MREVLAQRTMAYSCVQQLYTSHSRQGWLSRRNKHTTLVSTRYMMLEGNYLYSFKRPTLTEHPQRNDAQSVYDLSGCVVTCEWKTSSFLIHLEGAELQSSMTFTFSTLKPAQDWANCFQRASALGAFLQPIRQSGLQVPSVRDVLRALGAGVNFHG